MWLRGGWVARAAGEFTRTNDAVTVMECVLTEEQLECRALARAFAEGEIRPYSAGWDARGDLDDEIFGKLAELGFLGMLVPEEFGGLGFDLVTYLLVLEELAWGDAALGLALAIHNGPCVTTLLRHGSQEQCESVLSAAACGESLLAFALSEPGAGSDAASLTTRAQRLDGSWRLSGDKRWVTNGGRAGRVLAFARTGEGERHGDGIGAFLLDPESDGYQVVGRETTMGLCASETVSIRLDDLEVDEGSLIGDPAMGFQYAMEALDVGRVGIAAQALGIGRSAFEHATRYATERRQFGSLLADFGATQEKLAEMATLLEGARALTQRAARALEIGRSGAGGGAGPGERSATALCAMAKLSATRSAMWITNQAVQIFGGYGYMRDYPVEKLMRDAKGAEIYEGTNEIMRLVIARDVLRATGADN